MTRKIHMSQARRALVMLVSVIAAVVGFTPASGAATISVPEVGAHSSVQTQVAAPEPGYWLVASDGGIFSLRRRRIPRLDRAIALNQPIVGMAATPGGNGYWLVASDGGIFTFGDAQLPRLDRRHPPQPTDRRHGRDPDRQRLLAGRVRRRHLQLRRRAVPRLDRRHRASTSRSSAWPPTPDGNGYWLVASDGGIFTFGDAQFHGSTGAHARSTSRSSAWPPTPSAATATGSSRPTAASSPSATRTSTARPAASISTSRSSAWRRPRPGTATGSSPPTAAIFTFGDAHFLGSTGSLNLNQVIVGIAALTPPVPAVLPDPATQLAFTAQPSDSTGGTAFATQPAVTVQDASGVTVTTDTSSVTLSITTPAGALLHCTNTTSSSALAGIATFSGCNIDQVGTYTLHAADGALTAATSDPVTITVGTAARLGFTAQPSGAASSVVLAAQPHVAVQDLGGNTVTATNTGTVTLTITQPSSPAGAALTCTNAGVAVAAGVAVFAGCKIDLSGSYRLHAVDGLLTPANSNSMSVTAAGATKLAFTTSPSPSTGGVAFTTQPVVKIEDAAGNTVTSDASGVTLTITTPAGALLNCTNASPLPAASGVATFTGCKIDLAGTYTLHAADAALTVASSNSFAITVGTAAKLGFTTSPSASTGGVAFTTQPVVAVQDLGGNTVTTTNTGTVAVTITQPSTPAGAALTCTSSSVAVAAGLAGFAGCNIDLAGSYTLHATDGALTTATSNTFAITVGPAVGIHFASSLTNAASGVAFVPQPVVAVQDLGGNTVTTTNSGTVALTITQPSTPAGAALTCTSSTVEVAAGLAAFDGCNIDLAGTYTLHAVDGAFTGDERTASPSPSAPPRSSCSLRRRTRPPAASPSATQPVVDGRRPRRQHRHDHEHQPVTLTITNRRRRPAPPSRARAPPSPSAAGAGDLRRLQDRPGRHVHAARRRRSVDAGDSSASLDHHRRHGREARVHATSPQQSTGGVVFGTQPDRRGPGPRWQHGHDHQRRHGDLDDHPTVVSGRRDADVHERLTAAGSRRSGDVHRLQDRPVRHVHVARRRRAAITATSNSVAITAAGRRSSCFTTSPNASTGGVAFDDPAGRHGRGCSAGNTVTSERQQRDADDHHPGGALLTCPNDNTQPAVNGVATFAGCRSTSPGTYTLHAADGTLTAATSNSFAITVGTAAKLGFTTSPSASTGGVTFTTQPVVAMQDLGGNTVTTTNTTNVMLTITQPSTPAGTHDVHELHRSRSPPASPPSRVATSTWPAPTHCTPPTERSRQPATACR